MRPALVSALLLALAVCPAFAHHRQTPPIVAMSTSGDATLPRLAPPSRKAISFTVDGAVSVVGPFRNPIAPTFVFSDGTNANPTISSNGRIVAFDSDADPLNAGAPGRQIVEQNKLTLISPAVDPTGTSENPAVDIAGLGVAFESTGDLAATGNAGARQVFYTVPGGTVRQMSTGQGTSRNPSIGLRGRIVVFDSTSDPVSGVDTGVPQIWTSSLVTGTATRITSGAGASEKPTLSNDGRVIVFESRADLAGDGHDTGVPQIFMYDTNTQTFARITNEPGGCTGAASARIMRDWRIGYVCSGTGYFTMLRANERFRVQTDGGDTTRLSPQGDAHFVLVATTADLLAGSGTTAGHRVYMVNLYARPPATATSSVVWFPTQGIPPL